MEDWKSKYQRPKKLKIVVEKVPAESNGEVCHCHVVGQEFHFDFERCPPDICAAAFHSLWPMLRVVELGGRHPWDAKPGITRVCCPDPEKPVTFRIEAVEEENE